MIHVERSALDSLLTKGLNVPFNIVDSVDEVPDRKSEIVLRQKHDNYCHPCPGTKIYRCCNYHTTDVMEGCPFDCSYCILQAYLPHKRIEVTADTDSVVRSIEEVVAAGTKRRLGTGELSDSLALDNIFPFTKIITPIINKQEHIQFEFKTKSANIANLLNLNPKNIVVSWSLNPQPISDIEESGTARIADRLAAAKICAEAGYRLAFHFDPVIYTENYQKLYGDLLNELFNTVPESAVEYISISTFRAPAPLMDKMRERDSVSKLLKGDMVLGLDSKFRYFKPLRFEILEFMTTQIYRHWENIFVYYCMEDRAIWKRLFGFDPGERTEFESLFPHIKGEI
ncbi:MAG: DNA photolyase [Deferribacteraceae bacterium]|jgi:spore photoproduct lyase|nr:DNA photolyase [Deferribacteraceae bacterium]